MEIGECSVDDPETIVATPLPVNAPLDGSTESGITLQRMGEGMIATLSSHSLTAKREGSSCNVEHHREPSMKKIKLEGPPTAAQDDASAQEPGAAQPLSGMVSPGHSAAGSNGSLADNPLKATHFRHLKLKYLNELEYMLCEFRKLERQLLGATSGVTTEATGSRERREKLRSFIQHLEETVQQIGAGCQLEAEGKSTLGITTAAEGASTVSPFVTREKAEEENVQKLEEHILGHLLPVKVRLKKQLAAQQGAKHNPAGMPVVRGKLPGTESGTPKAPTFLKTNPEPTQFGKPLKGGGSTLTQKLHGATLGSSQRAHGHGVGVCDQSSDNGGGEILYAGLAPGSQQVQSSVDAATSVHDDMIMNEAALLELNDPDFLGDGSSDNKAPEWPDTADTIVEDAKLSLAAKQAILCYEERRKIRKRRRKKKKLLASQQQQPKRKKSLPKRGPRSVEYTCAQCNEVYSSTCEYNPWWALSQHECPKCHKTQVPRVDITAPSNAIEYHPALLAHADDNAAAAAVAPVEAVVPPKATTDDSDLSDDDGILSDEDSIGTSDSDTELIYASMSPSDKAENERFGLEYQGPKMTDDESARLLTLMMHAHSCPCNHKKEEHREVCRSTKFMMLHVRDCPGTTALYDVCPFPWCRKVKHLLYHMVSCTEPDICRICSKSRLSSNMQQLHDLNEHRAKLYREKLIQKHAAVNAATASKTHKPTTKRKAPATVAKRNVASTASVQPAMQEELSKAPPSVQQPAASPNTVQETVPTKAATAPGPATTTAVKAEPLVDQQAAPPPAASTDVPATVEGKDEALGAHPPRKKEDATCSIAAQTMDVSLAQNEPATVATTIESSTQVPPASKMEVATAEEATRAITPASDPAASTIASGATTRATAAAVAEDTPTATAAPAKTEPATTRAAAAAAEETAKATTTSPSSEAAIQAPIAVGPKS